MDREVLESDPSTYALANHSGSSLEPDGLDERGISEQGLLRSEIFIETVESEYWPESTMSPLYPPLCYSSSPRLPSPLQRSALAGCA